MGTHPIFESDFDCLTDLMTAFTFDDFINAANGRETKSESLGKIFKKERPKTKPPLFDPTRPLLAGAAKNTVIEIDSVEDTSKIPDVSKSVCDDLEKIFSDPKYTSQLKKLSISFCGFVNSLYVQKSQANNSDQQEFTSSDKLNEILLEVEDKKLKHALFTYATKWITKVGFVLNSKFMEDFMDVIEQELLNTVVSWLADKVLSLW